MPTLEEVLGMLSGMPAPRMPTLIGTFPCAWCGNVKASLEPVANLILLIGGSVGSRLIFILFVDEFLVKQNGSELVCGTGLHSPNLLLRACCFDMCVILIRFAMG